jgi:hypothetical protein
MRHEGEQAYQQRQLNSTLLSPAKGYRHQMTANFDTRSGRLERLAKLARSALIEDLSPLVARHAYEAAGLSAAFKSVLAARCCGVHGG